MDGHIGYSAVPRASKAMQPYCRFLLSRIGALAVTVLLGGLLTAVLVRVSPGFLVDERELDPRLSESSRASIEREHSANRDVLSFYIRRLGRMAMHADWGDSPSLNRPIAQLLRERFPVTLQLMAIGVAGGWALAFALALPSVMCRSRCSAASRDRSTRSSCACPPPPWRSWFSTWAVRFGRWWPW